MSSALTLFLIVACFWSVMTSISAVVGILSARFKGDRSSWVLISMIAFIGPILWMIKGRKLLIGRTTEHHSR